MNNIELIVKEQGIETNDVSILAEAFGAPFTNAGAILATYKELEVTSADDTDLMKKAKDNRLALKKVRTTVENKRKELKADSLKTGKAIDAVANYIKSQIVPAEDYLETQERFAELIEEKRLTDIRTERIERLTPYVINPLSYADPLMAEDAFTELLNGFKAAKELDDAKTLAYETEQKRIADEKQAEDNRIRQENANLKAELEARELAERQEKEAQKAQEDMEAKLSSAPDKEKLLAFVSEFELQIVPTDTETAERIRKHIATSVDTYRKLINEEL